MAQDVTAIERLDAQPITVNPAAIEAEFSRLWSESAGAGFDESSIRSRVVNLVALGDAVDRDLFDAVMDVLPEEHPCRGILALTDPGTARLAATLGAHCWRSPGGSRHVCSEEVIFTGSPQHDRETSSAVLALLVPDIDVVVWFLGEPQLDRTLVERVLDAGDRAIVDSARCGNTAPFDAAAMIDAHHAIPVADLAWLRLAAWRALIAQSFDGAQAAELERVEAIEIAGSPDAAEPLLMAGWLLSRLGLTLADRFQGGNDLRATLYDGTRGVSLAIRPESSPGLRAVRIKTADGRRTLELHHESNHLHAEVPEPGGGSARRVFENGAMDIASTIESALASSGDDPVYVQSVAAARTLVSS